MEYVYYLDSRPDLKIWNEVPLNAEFTAQHAEDVPGLDAYRLMEERLFEQLRI